MARLQGPSRQALTWALGGLALAAGYQVWRRTRPGARPGASVLITGGSRGLGLAMAREFVQDHCRVAICARDPDELERARQDLVTRGGEVMVVRCDVSNKEDVHRMVEEVAARFGRIDVLVNNASILQVGPLETMSTDDFEHILSINLLGAVYATLAVLPHMRRQAGGRILNITSLGGRVAIPRMLPYAVSKFAMRGFSEGLAAELAKHHIQVTTVIPGLMRTGSFLHAWFKGSRAQEFAWFAMLASFPGFSMDAQRAARMYTRAMWRGDREVTSTLAGQVLGIAHDVAPQLVIAGLALVDRILPKVPVGAPRPALGAELRSPIVPPWLIEPILKVAEDLNETVAATATETTGTPAG